VRRGSIAVLAGVFLFLQSCGTSERQHPKLLSEWKILGNSAAISYSLRTPLFSDYADKDRVVLLAAGKRATYQEFAVFDFPVGTAIAKTFSFAGKRIETRVLVHEKTGWVGLPYVWKPDQSDAVLELVPDPVPLTHNGVAFEYSVPNANQCKACHENAGVNKPIGPKARHLDPDAIERLTGVAGAPAAPLDSLDAKARAYLDINCAHCHNTKGPANTSGLVLTWGEIDPTQMGVCKTPVAAGQGSGGLRFSIVPGRPDESILVHRMESTTPKVQMPELGRALVHREGVALIREWITAMKGGC